MLSKKEICEKYFNGEIKPKDLTSFETTTPEKNKISGYICRKRNYYLGSMLIESINSKPTQQFIQSMPKIHYFGNKQLLENVYNDFNCYEKIDGTCIIFYPLLDEKMNLIEVVPKTRNTPVADKFILKKLQLVDTDEINSYTDDINRFFTEFPFSTLIFELYGVLNQHEIFYPKTYIDLKLLTITQAGSFLNSDAIDDVLEYFPSFERPEILFSMEYFQGFWRVIPNRLLKIDDYLGTFVTQQDCIDAIITYLDIINENGFKTEGCVINGLDRDKQPFFIKIKPTDIFLKIRNQNSISKSFIVKEVYKYFDEFGSNIRENYDKDHCLNYIKNNLREEFSDDLVDNPNLDKKIEQYSLEVMHLKEPPVGLQDMCREIIDENPDETDIKELMRIFAQKYPHRKKVAKIAYSLFEAIL